MAAETGITDNVLDKAIEKMEDKLHEPFNWLMGSSEIRSSIIIEGEITDLQLDQLFPELNAFTGQEGTLEQIENGYSWKQDKNSLMDIRRVTIIPKDDKTKIIQHVKWEKFRAFGLGFSAILGAFGLALILKTFGIAMAIYLPLSAIGAVAGYFGFMGGLKFYFNKQKEKFNAIMQLIVDNVERPAQHRKEMGVIMPEENEKKQDQNS